MYFSICFDFGRQAMETVTMLAVAAGVTYVVYKLNEKDKEEEVKVNPIEG